jgi:hypothetical protein
MIHASQLPLALLFSLSSVGAIDADAFDVDRLSPPVLEIGATAPAPRLALSTQLGAQAASDSASESEDDARRRLMARTFLHGFRLGGMYIHNHERVVTNTDTGLQSAFMFLIGYEFFYRIEGGDWLNVLLVANVMIGGLEQSLFIPSANFLIGFEFDNQFQLGVGPNLTPPHGNPDAPEKVAHVSIAMGWTPLVGAFYVPVHFFFIPDYEKEHRLGMTVGVTW